MSENNYSTAATTVHTTTTECPECPDCKDWYEKNWDNPNGAIRECYCREGGHITILPTCKKCGDAPCGCTSEERYGRPVSPEDDLQIQTMGGRGVNGEEIKHNWAIEEDRRIALTRKQHKEEIAKPSIVKQLLKKVFG